RLPACFLAPESPRSPPLFERACFAHLLGAPPPAARAFAVRASDDVLEVIGAVIVNDFLTRLDVAQRLDEHPAAPDDRFGVGIAGMIEIARDVAVRGAVDGAVFADLVEVAVAAPFGPVGFLLREDRPLVFGDAEPLLDRTRGENAEPGERSAEAERS